MIGQETSIMTPLVGPAPRTPEWYAERRRYICASEAAAACGHPKAFASALEVYLRKRGELPEVADNADMLAGRVLEPAIIQLWCETDHIAIDGECPMAISRQYPWMAATPDGLVDGQWNHPVEIKRSNTFAPDAWGREMTDEIPEPYVIQCQHQIAVCGAEECRVGVLLHGRFRRYVVDRNERLIGLIVDRTKRLHDQVEAGTPPEPTWGHSGTASLVRSLYGVSAGVAVDLDHYTEALADEWEQSKAEAREAEKRAKDLEARILFAMGPAEIAQLPGGAQLIRKEIARAGYTVQPTTYTTLKLRRPK